MFVLHVQIYNLCTEGIKFDLKISTKYIRINVTSVFALIDITF